MRISMRVAAGMVTGLLISGTYAPTFAKSYDAQGSRAATTEATIPCVPLSWEAANKLPWFIPAAQVECMNPTQDDLQASDQARSLLTRAAAQMQSDCARIDSTAETEYNDGIVAYGAGRYVEAIGHFQAAVPPATR